MEVIQLDSYIKSNKLLFKPNLFFDMIMRFNKLGRQMVQKVALKKTVDATNCQYCRTIRDVTNGKQQLCKKHKAIEDWQKMDTSKSGRCRLFGHDLQIFNRYVITNMTTDTDGVYVLWFGESEENDCVYCLNKLYFPKVFEVGMDISVLVHPDNIVVYKNVQLYWDEDGAPRIENIK